jgi:lactate dehydrogenase-like 2-hydroxyacid dehydrogenase
MKDGVLIVDTARGPIVDEQALVDSLASGKVLRAALDVFEHEPTIHPALLANPAVTVLPHVAALNETIRLEIEDEQIANVRAFLKTGRGKTPVN